MTLRRWEWSGVVAMDSTRTTIGGVNFIDELCDGGEGFFNLSRAFVALTRAHRRIDWVDEVHGSEESWLTETTPDISYALYVGEPSQWRQDILELVRFCDGLEVTLSIAEAP